MQQDKKIKLSSAFHSVEHSNALAPVEFARVAILLLSMERARLLEDDDYWGAEEDVNLGNAGVACASKAIGVCISEDGEWTEKFNKATSDEIPQLIVDALLECFKNELLEYHKDEHPKSDKLYAVAFEQCGVFDNGWQDVLDNPDTAQIWSEIEVSEGRGWHEVELAELQALEVNQYVDNYGSQAHTIIRIR